MAQDFGIRIDLSFSIDTQQRGDINQRQQAASETGIKEKVVPLKKKELAAKMLQAFDGDQISWTLSIRRYTAINGRYRNFEET
jgi:uncharacterized glyoxalase superfamily protein PhnB